VAHMVEVVCQKKYKRPNRQFDRSTLRDTIEEESAILIEMMAALKRKMGELKEGGCTISRNQ